MDDIKIIEITDTLGEGAIKTNGNFEALAFQAENIVTGFSQQHTHNGQNSKRVSHDDLINKGIMAHNEIDDRFSDYDNHISNQGIHAGEAFKDNANAIMSEVLIARNSSKNGNFPTIGARINLIESMSGSASHDSFSGRHVSAISSNSCRHTTNALWDEEREQSVQDSLDELITSGSIEDNFVRSGLSGTTQKHLDDRLNSLYLSTPPSNLLPNGTFALSAQTGIATNQEKYLVAGWVVDTTDNTFQASCLPNTTLALSTLPEFDSQNGSQTLISAYANWHGSFVCQLTSQTNTWVTPPKFCSYPVQLELIGPYTFVFSYINPNTSKVKVQAFEDGTWVDIVSYDLPATATGEYSTKSFVLSMTSEMFGPEEYHPFIRMVFEPVNQPSGSLNWKLFKVGVFYGCFDSDSHKLPYVWFNSRDYANAPVTFYYANLPTDVGVFCGYKMFLATSVSEVDVSSNSDGICQIQIPPAISIHRVHVLHGYNQFGNKDAGLITPVPKITQSGLSVSPSNGVLQPGRYFYKMTFVNNLGVESTASAVLIADITLPNSSVSFTQPEAIPNGVTTINLYRGDSPDNLFLIRSFSPPTTTVSDNIPVIPTDRTPPVLSSVYLNCYNHFAWSEGTRTNGIMNSVIIRTLPPYSADGSTVTKKILVEVDYWPGPIV